MKQLIRFLIPLMLLTVGCSLKRHVQKSDTTTKTTDHTTTVVVEKITRLAVDTIVFSADSATFTIDAAKDTAEVITVLEPIKGTTITLKQKQGKITTTVKKDAVSVPIAVSEVIERTTTTKNDITTNEVIKTKDKESKTNIVWLIIAFVAVISVGLFLVYKYLSK